MMNIPHLRQLTSIHSSFVEIFLVVRETDYDSILNLVQHVAIYHLVYLIPIIIVVNTLDILVDIRTKF